LSAYAPSTLKGAGIGAIGGAALGALAVCAFGVTLGPLGIVICAYAAGPAAVAGAVAGETVGAAAGAVEGAAEKDSRVAMATIEPAALSLRLRQPLAEAVRDAAEAASGRAPELFLDAGPTGASQRAKYASLLEQGISKVIETRVVRFGFDGTGKKDPDVAVFMVARARLVDAASDKELWSREFAYVSRYAGLQVWAADDAGLVRSEYERAHHALAERIVEEAFFVTAPVRLDAKAPDPSEPHGACGLLPVSPRLEVLASTANPEYASVLEAAVDSPLPTLESKPCSLPEPSAAPSSPPSPIRYDLRIWRAGPFSTQGELVYQQNDIAGPSHHVSKALELGTTYLWSVRARYPTPDGIYATRWSQSRLPLYARRTALLDSVMAP
jgi:hypothetical protein